MNLQEKNWQNLFDDITTQEIAWHGNWTVYSPAKEIVKSYQGVRKFHTNEDKTIIYQTNTYIYPDGREEKQTWQIDKQNCNLSDGVIHPHILSARALSFGDGANAWISKQVEPGKYFNIELFFRYQAWRTSMACIFFGENSGLDKIFQIREHRGSFPDSPPTSELTNISENWVGKKQYIKPDLTVYSVETTQELVLDPTGGNNETFLLPDGVVVNTPKRLKVGEAFEIVAGKLVAENQFKRLTAQYDDSGAFALLISEVFARQE